MHFETKLPSAPAFIALRNSLDWGQINEAQADVVLAGSLGGCSIYDDGNLIAMARYIGDGILNIYIQDVVVAHNYRNKGIGGALISRLIADLQSRYPKDCKIGLMAAKGQDAFYTQYGFNARPSDVYGAGMIAALDNLHVRDGPNLGI